MAQRERAKASRCQSAVRFVYVGYVGFLGRTTDGACTMTTPSRQAVAECAGVLTLVVVLSLGASLVEDPAADHVLLDLLGIFTLAILAAWFVQTSIHKP